jgi:hypothetical protein
VTYITRVNVGSLNRSCRVNAKGKGALERACACARSIERGHSAVRSAHDNVIHITRVKGSCRDGPCGVKAIDGKNNGALAGACARVRSIKCSDGAVRSAQEPVTYIACVNVASRDRPRRVDVACAGTLAGTCARTRDVEGSDGTIRHSQETVKHIACVNVASRDRAFRVDGERQCALAGACPRARSVECGDGAVPSTQETMTRIAGVNVVSRDRLCRTDCERQCALARACTSARSIECGDGRLRANKRRVAEIQEPIVRAAEGSGRESTQQDRSHGDS